VDVKINIGISAALHLIMLSCFFVSLTSIPFDPVEKEPLPISLLLDEKLSFSEKSLMKEQVEPPVKPPVKQPVKQPVAPVEPPVKPPVKQPVAPVEPPVKQPVKQPVAPVEPPVKQPVVKEFSKDSRKDVLIESSKRIPDMESLVSGKVPFPGDRPLKRVENSATRDLEEDDRSFRQTLNDIIGHCVQKNWNLAAINGSTAYDLRVVAHFRLNQNGTLSGETEFIPAGGDNAQRDIITIQAREALKKCSPFALPLNKYNQWHDVTVNMKAFPG
jgi:hypothetical protein